MSHLNRVFILLAAGCVIASCADAPLAPEPDLVPAFSANGGDDNRETKRFRALATTTTTGPGSPGPASDPGCLNARAAGLHQAQFWIPTPTIAGDFESNVGRGTVVGNGCVDVSKAAAGGPFQTFGESVVTFRNGDLLYYRAAGEALANGTTAGHGMITGGTGRFAGSRGWFAFNVAGNQIWLKGHISVRNDD